MEADSKDEPENESDADRDLDEQRDQDEQLEPVESVEVDSAGPQQPSSPTKFRKIAIIAMCLTVGSAVGAGAFTFEYAEGLSYMSNDSISCANCHVMQEHYDAWLNSSHSAHAQCNDCHSDPTSIFTKLKCKAVNGFLHSYAFTTGDFHEPIQMTDWNRKQTEKACRKCHEGMVHQIDFRSPNGEVMSCTRCHADVGHPFK